MRRRLASLLGIVSVSAAATMSQASAASPLGLSVDGIHWSRSITGPLFDPSWRWVPGDSETATFYVRNQGGTAGDLTVEVLGSQTGDLIDSGDLHVTARGGAGTWTAVSETGTHRLLTAPGIPNGSVEPIEVNVTFDRSSRNQTQLRASDLSFRVSMSESNVTSNRGAGRRGGDAPELPQTGAPHALRYALIGAILAGTGLAFISRRDTPDTEDAHV